MYRYGGCRYYRLFLYPKPKYDLSVVSESGDTSGGFLVHIGPKQCYGFFAL